MFHSVLTKHKAAPNACGACAMVIRRASDRSITPAASGSASCACIA